MATEQEGGGRAAAEVDATRRTHLATERTQLAWWRTGLTALAVGVGVGRVVPELNDGINDWPYVVIGLAFAVYGVLLFYYGTLRGRVVEEALEQGRFAEPAGWANTALAIAGGGLAVATALLILFG